MLNENKLLKVKSTIYDVFSRAGGDYEKIYNDVVGLVMKTRNVMFDFPKDLDYKKILTESSANSEYHVVIACLATVVVDTEISNDPDEVRSNIQDIMKDKVISEDCKKLIDYACGSIFTAIFS